MLLLCWCSVLLATCRPQYLLLHLPLDETSGIVDAFCLSHRRCWFLLLHHSGSSDVLENINVAHFDLIERCLTIVNVIDSHFILRSLIVCALTFPQK